MENTIALIVALVTAVGLALLVYAMLQGLVRLFRKSFRKTEQQQAT